MPALFTAQDQLDSLVYGASDVPPPPTPEEQYLAQDYAAVEASGQAAAEPTAATASAANSPPPQMGLGYTPQAAPLSNPAQEFYVPPAQIGTGTGAQDARVTGAMLPPATAPAGVPRTDPNQMAAASIARTNSTLDFNRRMDTVTRPGAVALTRPGPSPWVRQQQPPPATSPLDQLRAATFDGPEARGGVTFQDLPGFLPQAPWDRPAATGPVGLDAGFIAGPVWGRGMRAGGPRTSPASSALPILKHYIKFKDV